MKFEHVRFMLVPCVLILLFGLVACDINQDKEKCTNQLIGLATCLPYVSGEANAPPIDCCTSFKQVVAKSAECVCTLVKDRNDPSLGLQINATRALSLPSRCKLADSRSITDCPNILHLPPNSPDRKVFEDFANIGKNSTAPAPTTAANATADPTSAAARSSRGAATRASTTTGNQEGGGGKIGKRWLGMEMVPGLLITMVVVHKFFNHKLIDI